MPTIAEPSHAPRAVVTEARPLGTPPSLAIVDERRTAPRVRRRLVANVVGLGADKSQACVTQDISENGLFIQVPNWHGLRVGQRCEVVLDDEAGAGGPSALAGERRYATVVRTEPLTRGTATVLGAGLRFDQPLFL